MCSAYRPLLDFMIVGAQKCGTTALAYYLAQHPRIGMSSVKEPHIFDAPDYSPDWTPEQIDARYRQFFQHCPHTEGTPTEGTPTHLTAPTEGTPTFSGTEGTPTFSDGTPTAPTEGTPTAEGTPTPEGTPIPNRKGTSTADLIRGEATPIYLFLPGIAPELKRYNPRLKLIVMLRDPVQRAVSHYYMEKNRARERLPLWLALRSEPWRLWRCKDPRRLGSAWRCQSYRRRGLYSVQLRNLYRYFDAGQVLVVRTEDLAQHHEQVLRRVFAFLGAPAHHEMEPRTVFEGDRGGRRHRLVSWLLRLSYQVEFVRLRKLLARTSRRTA